MKLRISYYKDTDTLWLGNDLPAPVGEDITENLTVFFDMDHTQPNGVLIEYGSQCVCRLPSSFDVVPVDGVRRLDRDPYGGRAIIPAPRSQDEVCHADAVLLVFGDHVLVHCSINCVS